MSLINQMLKDLARRSKPLPGPDVILSGLVTTSSSKFKFNHWFIASSLFLALMIMIFIMQPHSLPSYHQHHTTSIALPPQSHPIPTSEPTLAGVSSPQLTLNPVELTGITLQVQNDMTNLRLLLSQNALYRITSDGNDKLMIILENTRLIANLPQIDTMNSAVKIIKMMNHVDGSLSIMLTLNPGAELSHIGLNEVDNLAELQIDLSYKNAVQDEVTEEQQTSSIKKISYDTSVDDEYQRAMHFLNQGQNNEAITQLTKHLVKYPEFVPSRKSLATLLLKQGNISKAQQVINAGLQQQPLYPPYLQLKAQILVDKGKIKQALDLLRMAPPPLEENPEYHAFLAALYQRQNKSGLAEKLYEQLLNLHPNNSIWWLGLGIARESLSKKKEALEAYTKANDTDNLSPELKVYVENRINALL